MSDSPPPDANGERQSPEPDANGDGQETPPDGNGVGQAKKPGSAGQPRLRVRRWIRTRGPNVVEKIVGGLALSLILALLGFAWAYFTEDDPPPFVTMTRGGDVPQEFRIEGEASHLREDDKLYLRIDDPDGSSSEPIEVELEGGAHGPDPVEWDSTLMLGDDDDTGRFFTIQAVLAESDAGASSGKIVSSLSVRRTPPPPIEPDAEIEGPWLTEKSLVVSGTAIAIPDDRDVWVVLEFGDLWFPQGTAPVTIPDDLSASESTTWQHQVNVGQEGDAGVPFAILAVMVPDTTSEALRLQLARGFDGIEKQAPIWNGAEVLARSNVERSGNDPQFGTGASFTNVGRTVPIAFVAEGEVIDLPSGDHVWVAVGINDRIWLHGLPIVGTGAGVVPFAVPVAVGIEGDTGAEFTMLLLRMSASVSRDLAEWREDAEGEGMESGHPLLATVETLLSKRVERS